MLTYLLQMIACSGILYAYYHFFLRNEKFHQYNRFYLLVAIVISLLLPFLKIPVFVKDETNPVYAFISTGENIVIQTHHENRLDFSLLPYILYLAIALFFITRIIVAINRIVKIKNASSEEYINSIRLINTSHPDAPFSFFKWLFWNKKTEIQSNEGQHIFLHEMYHIRSKHSWDLLFMELILSIFWFNPFFYLYRKEIKTIQEFLADKYASAGSDTHTYAELLLLQAIQAKQLSLVNPFFHNQLKRRIAMLTTSKKTAHQWLRKLLVLPLTAVAVILFGFTYKTEITTAVNDKAKTIETFFNKFDSPKNNQAEVKKIIPEISEKKDTIPSKKSKQPLQKTDTDEEVFARSLNEVVVVGYTSDNESNSTITPSKNEVYTKVEVEAQYPGEWQKFLERNLNGNLPITNGAKPGIYRVFIQFIIDKEGNISKMKPLSDVGYGMEKEAMRVIEKSGKWRPAIVNGRAVMTYRTQPITFQVITEKKAIQDKEIKNSTMQSAVEPEIFTKVEIDAQYPGNWSSFLERNLNIQIPVDNGANAGIYTTITQFIVDKAGNLSNFKSLTNVGHGMEEEALRVIKRSGKWKPAIQNGREVTAFRKQPITFQVLEK